MNINFITLFFVTLNPMGPGYQQAEKIGTSPFISGRTTGGGGGSGPKRSIGRIEQSCSTGT